MKTVLVDTSVWVDHFKRHNAELVTLLDRDLVLVHPWVIGEIACGTPPKREQTLIDLEGLQPAVQASNQEVLAFIARERLHGLGCGWVDFQLLASTLLTQGSELWTMDKRLSSLAERFSADHRPVTH
jgi:predicted nucleic acid-binding protein